MKPIYPLLIATLSALSSCKKLGLCHDTEFIIKKAPFTGGQLRTDGFYYGRADTDYIGIVRYDLLIFYNDGVVVFPGGTEQDSIEQYLDMITHNGLEQDVKREWGAFNVEGTTIKIEKWQATYAACTATELMTGQILNDTTFVLTSTESRKNKGKSERSEINEQYCFWRYHNKPDSTNDIIK